MKIIGNRDGIDVDSCKNVRIENCDINTGDDSISLKSGRGLDGARIGKPTENVLIENCNLVGRHFACLGIGSETSGGIRDVRIEHCKLASRTFGIYIKTRIGRAGVIENIYGDNLDILGGGFLAHQFDQLRQHQHGGRSGGRTCRLSAGQKFLFLECARDKLPDARGRHENFAPEKPLEGLVLKNISGNCTNGISLANISGVKLHSIKMTGYQGALLSLTNVQGSGLPKN